MHPFAQASNSSYACIHVDSEYSSSAEMQTTV